MFSRVRRHRGGASVFVSAVLVLATIVPSASAQPIDVDFLPWDEIADTPPLRSLADLGFNDDEQRLAAWAMMPTLGIRQYRFGDDPNGEPTLDEPGTRIEGLGALQVRWDSALEWPDNGTIRDGNLYLSSGSGMQPDVDYVLFYLTTERPFDPNAMMYFVNQGFVTSFPDAPGWMPLPQLPGDTWGGGWRIPTVEYGPNPWAINLYRFDPDNSSSPFTTDPCDCFGGFHGDTFFLAVPTEQLVNQVADFDVADLRFGVHLHHHDGQFGATADSNSFVSTFPAVPGRTYEDFEPLAVATPIVVGTTTAPTTTTTSTTTTTTTTTTAAGGPSTSVASAPGTPTTAEPTDAGFPWILLFLLVLIVAFLLWWFFGRKRGEGEDPRDTPPPTTYDEESEHTSCDWNVYFDDANRGLVPLRPTSLASHECCRYVIRIKTRIVTHDQAARGRQDAGDERLRIPDLDWSGSFLDLAAHASTRSGPSGRLDWMQGYGDATEQGSLASDDGYWQRAQGEEPPEVAAHLSHAEKTYIAVDLKAGCPDYENTFTEKGESWLDFLASQECTNDDPTPPCPVELSSLGAAKGRISGDLYVSVGSESGSDIDELERPTVTEEDEDRADELEEMRQRGAELSHQHTADLSRAKPTFPDSDHDRDTTTHHRDRARLRVYDRYSGDAGIIVPVRVWPTTERVSAHVEAKIEHLVHVEGKMVAKNCEETGCGGHGECRCAPKFTLHIDSTTAYIEVEDKKHPLAKRPLGGDRRHPPSPTTEKWVLA